MTSFRSVLFLLAAALIGGAVSFRSETRQPAARRDSPLEKQPPIAMPNDLANKALQITKTSTEDDFPAAARAADGTIWLAFAAYKPGRPIVRERILNGQFDELVAKENGDQILLMRFDGKTWHSPIAVTQPGIDVWRPTVAIDGKNNVVVAWSQQVKGNWDIFSRRYQPGKRWSKVVRHSTQPGTDFHVVSATDSKGVVWLAWQSWQKDNFDIMAMALADQHPWQKPRVVSNSSANDWSPALAADSKGTVYVAWDTYDQGNYDVRLRALTEKAEPIAIAESAKFEARPSIVCDDKNRVWIAYEEGDEQWGKRLLVSARLAQYLQTEAARLSRVRAVLSPHSSRQMPGGKHAEAACPTAGCCTVGESLTGIKVFRDWQSTTKGEFGCRSGITLGSTARERPGSVMPCAIQDDSWSKPVLLPSSTNLLDNRPALVAWQDQPFGGLQVPTAERMPAAGSKAIFLPLS
ncbi:MAG: hypothetical protein KatS3mg105_4785 [Gemmatales bacterium]|nr:MAG: hypothetical protein KatS3mg105_4785 [Gemmatales bacterium]